MEVFKVVRIHRRRYYSVVARHPLGVEYRVGIPTYPRFGKLMAFETLKAAQNYAWRHSEPLPVRIFRAEAIASEFQDYILRNVVAVYDFGTTMKALEMFWASNRPSSVADNIMKPLRTVFCDAITILEEVQLEPNQDDLY